MLNTKPELSSIYKQNLKILNFQTAQNSSKDFKNFSVPKK